MPKFNSATSPLDAAPSLASRLVGAGWSVLGRISPFNGEASEDQLWKHALRAGSFVHIPNVRAAAQAWIAYMADHPPIDYTDRMYSRAGFARAFSKVAAPGEAALSAKDVDVLLRWLERDAGKVVVDGDVSGDRPFHLLLLLSFLFLTLTLPHLPSLLTPQIIKITSTASPITEADRGAVAVGDALDKVDAQIASAEKEADACHAKAREKIAAGQRTSAAAYLRSKKQLDEVIGKRIAAGEQLRSVHRALNQAKGDAEVSRGDRAAVGAR